MKKPLILLAALLIAPLAATADAAKPNIILVMPDDVGYGDYACLGSPIMKTPSVDAFKKQSLLLTEFHVSPTCAPTRAALMSGRHEFKNGVTHTIYERERMALSTFTLPQMLKTAGYTTGIFGKWHLGDEEEYRPENRGFDEVYTHGGGGIGQTYPGSCGDAPGNTNINPALWHNGKWVKTEGYCTDLFFDQSIKWMDAKRKEGQPFFAYVSLNAAHSPYVLPEKYYKHYVGLPEVNDKMAKFFGMIENVDTNFGKLLAKVDEWGIADNTLVIYLGSDNGGTLGHKIYNADRRGTKGRPYQGSTRVPCFFRWPKGDIPADTDTAALTSGIDIYPTLAEIAGAKLSDKVEKQVEGISLVPLLKNPKAEWPYRTLVHHVGRWDKGKAEDLKYTTCSIQDHRFALVNNKELYDLKADPGEQKNVISQHPEVVEKLRAAYDQWWTEVQPFMVNEDATGPEMNPMKELYWAQFGGEPDSKMKWQMKPDRLINAHKSKETKK
ncbi:arylsulfatase [Haloferula chungangensis]|uniref:Arylsulfatase n=1 Tax=Haloferula chungangensis TaxID=1048331 RepID=A0ABW2L647_9BACT